MEFAFVLPLFFLVLAGIIEFGQAFRVEHMLNSASRQGARSAVIGGSTTSEVQKNVITRVAETLGVKANDVIVKIAVNGKPIDLSKAEKGDEISVSVSVPYAKAGIGFFANMLSNSSLSSNCIFEHE